MDDVLIVGAGPAGAIAGLVLARAGARVRIVDRASFPRDKMCGDTVNPGALSRLRALGVAQPVEARSLRVGGMVVTSDRAAIVGRYPAGLYGCAILRRDLDWLLLQQAVAAGCAFEPGVAVSGATLAGGRVTGASTCGAARGLSARVTIAADGRRSAIAWTLGAARYAVHPRRWAIGAYFGNVGTEEGRRRDGGASVPPPSPFAVLGEMHVRRNCYIGVAPVGQELTNVCVVRPSGPADAPMRDPLRLLTQTLRSDPQLRGRFAHAVRLTEVTTLGPLGVDVVPPALDGLILAGDAAGFVDPMTGDGLRFAIRGGELAAAAALEALTHGWRGVHARHAARRRQEFGGKQWFNRGLRQLVASPRLVDAAAAAARLFPSVLSRIVTHAGDCGVAMPIEREASGERTARIHGSARAARSDRATGGRTTQASTDRW